MARTYQLSPAALTVLAEGVTTPAGSASAFVINSGQLDRKLYEEVNKALVAFGGKWARKEKAHLFGLSRDELDGHLANLLDTGQFTPPQSHGYYPTPPLVLRDILLYAELGPDSLVLEPSAGRGAIADAAAEIVGRANVHCCELLEENRKHLSGYLLLSSTVDLITTSYDFLALGPRAAYNRVLMNPPFDAKQVHIDHVLHAYKFLIAGGLLVAILPSGVLFRQDAKAKQLRELVESTGGLFAPLPDDSFATVGTNVRTCLAVLHA